MSRRAILLWSTHDADRRGERGGHLFSTTTWGLANEWSVLSVTSPAACPAQCQLCCNGLTLSSAASSSPHSALSEVKVPHDLNRASSNKVHVQKQGQLSAQFLLFPASAGRSPNTEKNAAQHIITGRDKDNTPRAATPRFNSMLPVTPLPLSAKVDLTARHSHQLV